MAYEKAEDTILTSLKDLDFVGNPTELDLTEDAWEYSAPPPAGIYDLKLFLAKDGLVLAQRDKKDPLSKYVKVAIEARIKSEDPDIDNLPLFERVSSLIPKRKKISTMAGLIVKLGYGAKLPKPCTDKDMVQIMLAILKKEPILKAEVDWKASYKYTNKKGEEEWVNVYNHFNEFPKEYRDVAKFSIKGRDGNMIEMRPMLYVAKWFGKGETPVMSASPTPASPVFAAPVVASDTPVFAPATAATPALVSQPRGPVAPTPTEEDLELMLAD